VADNPEGEKQIKINPAEHQVNAVLFQQTAAEYRALCYQAFNIAKLRLEMDSRKMGLSRQKAIVLDIDETVLDNSPHGAMCILNNTLYPDYWKEWMDAANAKAVPGVLEFLKYAEKKGITIYYISNRKEKYLEQTLKNLKDLDFPFADKEHIFLRTDESSKKARREKVSKTYDITLLIGDNLNDFSEIFEHKSIAERFELIDKMKGEFGKRFIVLPNAMYGEWEGAIYDYNYGKTNAEKSEARYEHLRGF
jgi:5'-nucleotidase (lipoprotein e(P4) family)